MSLDRPGFADAVRDSQASFRAVLGAMAEPGRVVSVGTQLSPPEPLDPATAAVLLTLVDAETPLWADAAASGALPWITFHCGAPPAPADAASFALSIGLPQLGLFDAGDHEGPELGATLIVQVAALGRGRTWRLRGPGLSGTGTLMATGLPDDFAALWAPNAALYPRGVDLILCAGDAVAALPRSITVA